MNNKNNLAAFFSFIEEEQLVPSFIMIYIMTWIVWHNQLFGHFMDAQGDFMTKVSSAFSALDDNQYMVVFFLTSLIVIIRTVIHYLKLKSQEITETSEDIFTRVRDDQKFAKDSDIGKLMDALTKTKQQLAESREKEQLAIEEKTNAIKKILTLENELDEVKADISVLTQAAQATKNKTH